MGITQALIGTERYQPAPQTQLWEGTNPTYAALLAQEPRPMAEHEHVHGYSSGMIPLPIDSPSIRVLEPLGLLLARSHNYMDMMKAGKVLNLINIRFRDTRFSKPLKIILVGRVEQVHIGYQATKAGRYVHRPMTEQKHLHRVKTNLPNHTVQGEAHTAVLAQFPCFIDDKGEAPLRIMLPAPKPDLAHNLNNLLNFLTGLCPDIKSELINHDAISFIKRFPQLIWGMNDSSQLELRAMVEDDNAGSPFQGKGHRPG